MKSYWIETARENRKDHKKLENNITTDVCIIGGGLTGLSVAYYLKESKLRVCILERDEICSHTSGNTTGKITSQHGLFYNYLIDSKGVDYAKMYLKANEKAIQNIADIINKEKIDCDLKYEDSYVFTQKLDEVSKIKDEVEEINTIYGRNSIKAEFVKEIDLPINIMGAIKFSNQAQFHPVKYAYGLIDSMKNVEIYENTKAVDLRKKDSKYVITAENGKTIECKYVVIATNYPIINTPGYYFLKMYQVMSYIIAIKPNEKIYNGMYINSEEPTISIRNQGDLVLIGGNSHKTGAKIDLKNAYNYLEKVASQIYPKYELKYKWCTEDCVSLDKIPYIGEFSNLMPNVYIGTGYKKWGMTSSNISGKIISDKILRKENAYEEVFKSTRMEPIKNIKEVENMAKETINSLILNKLDIPKDTIEKVNTNEGKIVQIDGKKVGIYKDEKGKIYAINPICSHLGCELSWNNIENTWDCPCHGSRFDYMGRSIYAPSIKDISIIKK